MTRGLNSRTYVKTTVPNNFGLDDLFTSKVHNFIEFVRKDASSHKAIKSPVKLNMKLNFSKTLSFENLDSK